MIRNMAYMAFLLWGCASEDTIKIYNADPTALITSHSEGDELLEGYEYTFVGQVQDDNHAAADLTVQWSTDIRSLCADSVPDASGATTCRSTLTEDDTQIKLQVTDPDGAAFVTALNVSIVPTGAPQIVLLSPTITSSYYSDQLIHFSAIISDTEDEPQDLQYSWTSSLDGVLPINTSPDSDGSIDGYVPLSAGQHAISLRVEDSSQKVTTESVAITVGGPNNEPQCSILTPQPGEAFVSGQSIYFSGHAEDADINNSLLNITWESDQDGVLNTNPADTDGSIGYNINTLSAGNHSISLRVEDEVGGLCQTSVQIAVGTPPQLSIISPSNGDILSSGSSISFSATVSDQEDVASNIDLSWESNLDGVFSTQSANSNGNITFSSSNLSVGLHNIIVTATDSMGLTDTQSFSIRINTPPTEPSVTISPDPADANDTLTATATGSIDADGDIVSFSYTWYRNGIITSHTTAMVPSSATSTGDIWMVQVTPSDGYVNGNYGQAFLTILNSGPQFDTAASITPNSSVYTGTSLTCSATASDLDDGVLSVSYSWSVGGVQIASGATYTVSASNTNVGDTITCTATAIDSDGEIETSSAAVVVSNTAPQISGPTLSTSTIFNDDTISCSAIATDPDESITPAYEWSVANVFVGTGSILDLSTTSAMPGDIVSCQATITDSSSISVSGTDSATVSNRAPSSPTISIAPTSPMGGQDDLVCSITAPSTDPDGQTVSYVYSWQIDGVLSSFTSDTISGGYTQSGEVWTCLVTPTDGSLSGTAASASVSIAAEDSDGDGILDTDDICDGFDDTIDTNSNGIPDDCESSLTYTYTGGMQTWTVPSGVSVVSFTAYGAQGAHGNAGNGGLGAIIQGTFDVNAGDTYDILIGEHPSINYGSNGHNGNSTGGGGGTFVSLSSTPVIIAGGGGGGGAISGGSNAEVGESGGNGQGSGGASGGSSGNGGSANGGLNSGRSGAGFYSDGGVPPGDGGVYCSACSSSRSYSFLNGGGGGPQGPHHGPGGFGGGACGGNYGGGGGGGYSGGGGGSSNGYGGGGGGSYNSGSYTVSSVGNSGHGSLVIIFLDN